MRITLKNLLFVIIFNLVVVSVAAAEDLYIVEKGDLSLNSIAKLESVNVYGSLKSVFFAGATPSGIAALQQNGMSAEMVGVRDINSEYFIFWVSNEDIGKLEDNIEIIFFRDGEAIGRSDGPVEGSVAHFLKGLTRVSFVPKPVVDLGANIPRIEPLTDPEIEAIVAQVSEAQYTNYIQTLQNFGTRYSYTTGCRNAELWAQSTMDGFGYSTELFPFDYSGNTWYNVIGRKTGLAYPDSVYIIIGHIDATSGNPNVSAPGAEDNGSGSACVLEAARVLSSIDLNCTIEFVLVSGEEQGLIGSEVYAQYCYNNSRNIAGVLNFDMISYAGEYGWDTNIFSDQNFPAEVALANLLAVSTDDYTTAYSVRVNSNGPEYGSDHYYFSYYGFPAPFSIDAQLWSAPDWYPWYHSTSDVITNLDLDFGTEVVKGGVATLATIAGLYSPPVLVFTYPDGRPDLLNPGGGTTFRVEVSAGTETPQPGTGMFYYNDGSGFTGIPMEVVSPNVYDAVFPSINCGVVVSYYLGAESSIGTIVTDPLTAPDYTYSALSASNLVTFYNDDFDSNVGWTMNGLWGIGQPLGGGGEYGNPDPSNDHSPDGPNSVLGYNLSGDYENDLLEKYATSPIIDCSEYFGVTLRFFRWLGVEQPTYDHAYIRVSVDGVNWTNVFSNPGTITDNSWVEQVYDVSEWADGQANFRIRFVMGDTDYGWRYCGWNIDDMTLTGYYCGTQQEEVPTLSEWGMLIMGLLLLVVGTIALVRKKSVPARKAI
ncbi:MAG: IPTL-CTERM sorting domain-containing protein [candidate division Zixibacteria bacterium]